MKRTLIALIPITVLLIALYVLLNYLRPEIERFVLYQIRQLSAQNLPVEIAAQKFSFRLLGPILELEDIQINAKKGAQLGFEEINIDSAKASIDFIQFLGGKIMLSSFIISQPDIEIDLDALPSKKESKSVLDIKSFFQLLEQVPLQRLVVNELSLEVKSEKQKLSASSDGIDLYILNQKNKVNAQLEISSGIVKLDHLSFPFSGRLDLRMSDQALYIHQLQLTALASNLIAKGEFSDLPRLISKPTAKLNFEIQSNLEGLHTQLKSNLKALPSLYGKIHTQTDLNIKQGELTNTQFTTLVENLKINRFDIGDIQLSGKVDQHKIQIPSLKVTNEAGVADLKDTIIHFERLNDQWTTDLKTKLSSDYLDLNELLIRLNVGDIPVELFINSEFDCGGPLFPDLNLKCDGKAKGSQLEVRSGAGSDQTIVAIEEFAARGSVNISEKDVTYSAQLQLGNGEGSSDGVISYTEGFNINYSTPMLNFKNIKNLANLKLEGSSSLSGKTTGDSNGAVFHILTDAKDIYFENYYLGNPKGNIRYEKGRLFFENFSSTLQTSRFDAQVIVDLQNSLIEIQGESLQAEVSDILKAFERHVHLPIELTGPIRAKLKASGPLQFNKLSYNLTGQVNQGSAAGESYDYLDFDIESKEGNVVARKVQLKKGSSVIELTGNGYPNGQIDFFVKGDKLQLDESENISKLGSNTSGILDFSMSMTGHVLSPDIQFKSQVQNLIIDEQEFPPSNLSLKLTKKSAEGVAFLLGNRLKCEFNIPYDESSPFRLKATAVDWNYATIFTLIGGGKLLNEYETSVTGTIDLAAETGGFFKSTGKALIEKFILKRGPMSLQNRLPMELSMHNGDMTLKNFKVSGDQSSVEVIGENFSKNHLNLKVNGQAPLRLFQIFLPFLEELGGQGQLKMSVGGSLEKPEVLGQAQASNAFVKIRGFPHPFEQVQTSVQFSHSKILISEIKGTLAGGKLQGDGIIQIEGIKNLPTKIKARADGVNLVIPDKIRTQGSADVLFSGNWFPFTLSGTYNVTGGFIDNEFDEQAANQLNQSSYLPKMILQSAFEPILLDIQVNIDKSVQIKNSKIEGSLTGNLQVKGPPTSPVLFGRVSMEKNSKILFRDKIFDIQAGSVQFTDPKQINPELYFTARSHISEYDVNLLLQGTGKSPLIKLTSTPPLSEQDIVSLLALGITSSKLEKGVQSKEQESSLLYQAGTAVLSQSTFAKAFESAFGVNLEFSSIYNDTKNTNVKKVTLSKNITKKLKFSASHLSGEQSSDEVRLQYLFSPQFSAISSWESRQTGETSQSALESQRESQEILGLDLEFKKEFR
ncbi:MAG: hypothetical protein BroJett040_02970 [Oligoflexia bacterium]|nr:MAG: hypothetical protein BroJett040_02970 [Oligoflexia bacterium]